MDLPDQKIARVSFSEYASLLKQYLRPLKWHLVGLALFMGLSNVLPLLSPQIIRFFIDSATNNLEQSKDVLGPILIPFSKMLGQDPLIIAASLFIAVSILGQLVRLVHNYLAQDVAWKTTNQMRGDLAEHCLSLDMSFHNQKTPGEMVERVDGDTSTLASFFSALILQVAGGLLRLTLILLSVLREDWRIGVAMITFTVVAMFVFHLTRSVAVPIYAAEREGYALSLIHI